jgi:hypothetical protein
VTQSVGQSAAVQLERHCWCCNLLSHYADEAVLCAAAVREGRRWLQRCWPPVRRRHPRQGTAISNVAMLGPSFSACMQDICVPHDWPLCLSCRSAGTPCPAVLRPVRSSSLKRSGEEQHSSKACEHAAGRTCSGALQPGQLMRRPVWVLPGRRLVLAAALGTEQPAAGPCRVGGVAACVS